MLNYKTLACALFIAVILVAICESRPSDKKMKRANSQHKRDLFLAKLREKTLKKRCSDDGFCFDDDDCCSGSCVSYRSNNARQYSSTPGYRNHRNYRSSTYGYHSSPDYYDSSPDYYGSSPDYYGSSSDSYGSSPDYRNGARRSFGVCA